VEAATNNDALDDLAGAILDGTPIDWSAARSGDGVEQPALDRMRLLAAIADFHRNPSQLSEVAAPAAVADHASDWGHLRVLERIGCGAFGEVYRAWDTRLDREVALKLLLAESALASTRATSIIEEGRLLARVRHPNVVTIYGAERIGDRVGLWMEFIKGRTLAQVIEQDGVLDPPKVVEVGTALCRAVDAVHKAGLLHRDIKAHNVMLADDGLVVQMDFVTGRELGHGFTDCAGTPLYLAPELLSGGAASTVSDVYSVGVLLYFLLSGSYPVRAPDIRQLRLAHERHDRTPIKTVRPDVPPKLARLIDRAIDARPENRYQSVEGLKTSLTALEPPPPAPQLTYAIALTAAVVLIGWMALQLRSRDSRGAAVISAVPATTAAAVDTVRRFDPAARPIIAVLPFKNISSEAVSDYFVDGLTDELIRNLAVIEGMDVRSRTSSFFFKNKPRNLRDVAAQLGVNLIVEGSVLRSGRRLRVNAQLVSVVDDTALWSHHFDGDAKDIFAIQDEISRAIVNQLRLALGRGQRRYDTDVEAYELYLKARALVDQRGAGVRDAASLFRQVIARDPEFAPAYAGLVTASAFLTASPYGGGLSFETGQLVMRPAATKALQLDPLLAEAHAAMGTVYSSDRDWTNAEKSFRRAIELNPGLSQISTAFAFWTLGPLGRLDEAERLLRAALQADPLSLDVRRELARAYIQSGRYEEAVAELQHVKGIDPEFPNIDGALGIALMFAGHLPEALPLLQEQGDGLAYAYVLQGRRAEAEQMAVRCKGLPICEARVYAALGDKDRAFHALDRAMVTEPNRVARLLPFPVMGKLRGDPRLADLRRRLNLPPDVSIDRTP
jgi:TolB-like protein